MNDKRWNIPGIGMNVQLRTGSRKALREGNRDCLAEGWRVVQFESLVGRDGIAQRYASWHLR
jgi:hypothetical protein